MNDNDQKKHMERAWAKLPLGRATKGVWVVLKHGKPAGSDGRDFTVNIADAENEGFKGFGDNVDLVAPANQYLKIPGTNGESAQFRFSRDFVYVVSNSYSAHLARMVEANIRESGLSLDTALGIVLRSTKDLIEQNPGVDRCELAQRIIMKGSYESLLKSLGECPEYQEDLALGKVEDGGIRILRCMSGKSPEVLVPTVASGQQSYRLSMTESALTVLHGEMSGLVTDSPLTPSIEFPLASADYTVYFLKESGGVQIEVQWEPEATPYEDWSSKLMFR